MLSRDALRTNAWWSQSARDLLILGKPGVTGLLLFTAVATAWAASGPWTSLLRLLPLILAGGLTAAGAASLNQYLERELDGRMPRTARRPLPAGRIAVPEIALAWGLFLSAAGLALAALTLPQAATTFILLGWLIYVPLYTCLLKPRTPLAVVIGGAAGSCPILAAWATVRADWPIMPLALAALVFFWTPAHFWAYATVHEDAYRRAGFPMLPGLIGARATPPYILVHVVLAVAASLLALSGPGAVIGGLGGLVLLLLCLALWRTPARTQALRLYWASNYYLLLVFVCVLL